MIDHDDNCGGCRVNQRMHKHGGCFVTSDLAYCRRCGPTRNSSSYLHQVQGKSYCASCADIMAQAHAESFYVAGMYGVMPSL
ncbi:MAG TPA: hypothetical protein VL866_24285 [Pyrinomonadaceae bacterium]|nr:hypothetical protein [Pyrinomonadaceae bacterium]